MTSACPHCSIFMDLKPHPLPHNGIRIFPLTLGCELWTRSHFGTKNAVRIANCSRWAP